MRVGVDVDVVVDVADAEALNVPEAVSDPEIDWVLLLVDVDVAVVVAVAVDVAVAVAVATAAPVLTSTSQRYVVAVNDTEIIDKLSPTSAKLAYPASAVFNPLAAVTTTAPPPSVFIRRINLIPGFVGLARTLVSSDAPEVNSQICRSAFARIVPPSPGSVMTFGPRYKSCAILCGEILTMNIPYGKRNR